MGEQRLRVSFPGPETLKSETVSCGPGCTSLPTPRGARRVGELHAVPELRLREATPDKAAEIKQGYVPLTWPPDGPGLKTPVTRTARNLHRKTKQCLEVGHSTETGIPLPRDTTSHTTLATVLTALAPGPQPQTE